MKLLSENDNNVCMQTNAGLKFYVSKNLFEKLSINNDGYYFNEINRTIENAESLPNSMSTLTFCLLVAFSQYPWWLILLLSLGMYALNVLFSHFYIFSNNLLSNILLPIFRYMQLLFLPLIISIVFPIVFKKGWWLGLVYIVAKLFLSNFFIFTTESYEKRMKFNDTVFSKQIAKKEMEE